jgi:membrane protease YdiL (CAAX protease family)
MMNNENNLEIIPSIGNGSPSSAPEKEQGNKPHYFETFLWAIGLYFLPQLAMGIIFAIAAPSGDFDTWFMRADILAYSSFVGFLFTLPLIKIATKEKTFHKQLTYLAVKKVSKQGVWLWLTVAVVFVGLEELTLMLMAVDAPEFMLNIKNSTEGVGDLILVFIAICLIAPVVEELIFRGVLFARLQQTQLGNSGAILITSIYFASLHVQYDAIGMFVVLLMGLLLGWVRYKSNNTSYCILIHVVSNTLAMTLLYLDFY